MQIGGPIRAPTAGHCWRGRLSRADLRVRVGAVSPGASEWNMDHPVINC